MAFPVVLPKLGNTVESCIIVRWLKQEGDSVAEGEPLCEVETDKAVIEVESPASGTMLAAFFEAGDDVAIMTPIAAIGNPGEDIADLRPDRTGPLRPMKAEGEPDRPDSSRKAPSPLPPAPQPAEGADGFAAISPRAKKLATRYGVEITQLQGTGPAGRIIERDVGTALAERQQLTPLAQAMVGSGEFVAPDRGGRITSDDLQPVATARPEDEGEIIPVRGIRRTIAAQMLKSVQTTAQLTMNTAADARSLLAYREQLKASPKAGELQTISLNDLLLFAVSRTLPQHPELNAQFVGETIRRFKHVNLGFAVDTPRGLLVPVIRGANRLSLKAIAGEAKRLAEACQERRIGPDDLSDGTFTLSNLGSLGIESFTPILNPPQVAILGVGAIGLRPVARGDDIEFVPQIGLSLTIDHRAVDGAPAARFLQALSHNIANLELTLAY
jgi:pyruvate dehydrogenase E2 component (dihydrolipoamide acetyltransferase)